MPSAACLVPQYVTSAREANWLATPGRKGYNRLTRASRAYALVAFGRLAWADRGWADVVRQLRRERRQDERLRALWSSCRWRARQVPRWRPPSRRRKAREATRKARHAWRLRSAGEPGGSSGRVCPRMAQSGALARNQCGVRPCPARRDGQSAAGISRVGSPSGSAATRIRPVAMGTPAKRAAAFPLGR